MKNNSFTVYFRTGGKENFKWQRVLTIFTNVEDARAKTQELFKMGYPAHYARTQDVDSIGLPETYD
jgi:hypothetical protein